MLMPLAAVSDLLGLLVFVVIAIIGALSKRGQQDGGSQESGQGGGTRKGPEKMSMDDWAKELTLPPPSSGPSQRQPQRSVVSRPSPLTKQRETFARPTQNPPRLPVAARIPPPLTQKAAQKTFGRTAPSARAPKTSAPPVSTPHLVVEHEKDIFSEIQQSTGKLQEDIGFTSGELLGGQAQPTQGGLSEAPPVVRSNLSMLHSPAGLKQAIVIAEILGKPRALSSFPA